MSAADLPGVTHPAVPADQGLAGLIDVARQLYGAAHAALVLVDAAGRQRTVVMSGDRRPEGAGHGLVARVIHDGAVLAVCDPPIEPDVDPLLDPAGRPIGVLLVCTGRPDPLPSAQLAGLQVLASRHPRRPAGRVAAAHRPGRALPRRALPAGRRPGFARRRRGRGPGAPAWTGRRPGATRPLHRHRRTCLPDRRPG